MAVACACAASCGAAAAGHMATSVSGRGYLLEIRIPAGGSRGSPGALRGHNHRRGYRDTIWSREWNSRSVASLTSYTRIHGGIDQHGCVHACRAHAVGGTAVALHCHAFSSLQLMIELRTIICCIRNVATLPAAAFSGHALAVDGTQTFTMRRGHRPYATFLGAI